MNFYLKLFAIFLFCAKFGFNTGQVTTKPVTKIIGRLLTPEEGCGTRHGATPYDRDIGLRYTKLNDWPWIVQLGLESERKLEFNFGGSLITSRHVLTAAACFNKNPHPTTVRLGDYDKKTDSETVHIDVPIAKMVLHPEYDAYDGNNDLAVITMDRDIEFSENIRPICLPIYDPYDMNVNAWYEEIQLIGWGPYKKLKVFNMPLLSDPKQCENKYQSLNILKSKKQFNDKTLCAGYTSREHNACSIEDIGSPLVRNGYNIGNVYLVGVVSGAIPHIDCSNRSDYHILGVYVDVSTFVDWIKEVVNK